MPHASAQHIARVVASETAPAAVSWCSRHRAQRGRVTDFAAPTRRSCAKPHRVPSHRPSRLLLTSERYGSFDSKREHQARSNGKLPNAVSQARRGELFHHSSDLSRAVGQIKTCPPVRIMACCGWLTYKPGSGVLRSLLYPRSAPSSGIRAPGAIAM